MKVFSIEGLMRDGGSIKRIFTDQGEFSRVKKIGGRNNGFFNSQGKVEGGLEAELQEALDLFSAAKKEKYRQEKLKEAVQILIEALKTDEAYRESWKANIAMAFKDECYREFKEDLYAEYRDAEESIHEIANNASNNFLNLLCQ